MIGSPPLQLELGPSVRLTVALLTAHIGALVCLAPLEVAVLVKAAVAVVVLVSLGDTLCRHAVRCGTHAVSVLIWNRDGEWALLLRNGEIVGDLRLAASYVHPQLVALSFRARRWRWYSVILLPDAVDTGDLRKLRVRLRLAGANALN